MNMRIASIFAICLGATPLWAESHASGDAEAGEKVFRKCKSCHMIQDDEGNDIQKGGRTGPNLYGIYNRVAGSIEDYRYGDFIDLCCAITGRAPAYGLHLDANRRGQVLFRLEGFAPSLTPDDALFVAVGLIIGAASGELVPVIEGLPPPRPPALAPMEEGRRLLDSIGWAAILPQMLAALGAVFALAGVGDVIGSLAGTIIPDGNVFVAVVVFALGMAVFTMIMGNAFAAFPVMAAAIGIPLLVEGYGGNPAVIGAVGMLAGFCGTLLTPMAANFNIVPAALLELDDQNGVIKQQVWTAIPLWVCNIAIIYIGGFLLWS